MKEIHSLKDVVMIDSVYGFLVNLSDFPFVLLAVELSAFFLEAVKA